MEDNECWQLKRIGPPIGGWPRKWKCPNCGVEKWIPEDWYGTISRSCDKCGWQSKELKKELEALREAVERFHKRRGDRQP
jgi:hypothetical protein